MSNAAGTPETAAPEQGGRTNLKWLSIGELARILDVRVDHLRALVSRGEIPVGRVGRLVRFHWPTVQRWVMEQGRAPTTGREAP